MKDPRDKVHDHKSDIHAREKPAIDTDTTDPFTDDAVTTAAYVPPKNSNRKR